MEVRKIEPGDSHYPTILVERVLTFPKRTEPDATDAMLEHRLSVIPERGDRVLRVIINAHTTPLRVVTL